MLGVCLSIDAIDVVIGLGESTGFACVYVYCLDNLLDHLLGLVSGLISGPLLG